ncbi:MAG: hypothetical protein NC489_38645 [Ruminococcus flavefaciens]|nr:hypothetical protein [Ruminococcus flavefaciens]
MADSYNYIGELINALKLTEVWRKNPENGVNYKCADYDEGIKLLLDRFTKHKKTIHRYFL